MNKIFDFMNKPENQVSVSSHGAFVTRHDLKIFKKTYNRYPKHNQDNYDNQKFSNVVDKHHFENELKILKLLEDHSISPRVIDSEEQILYLSDCGQELCNENLPDNWKEQILNIYQVLKSNFLYHNDIKCDNFTVRDNKIYLIDFGWSSFYKPEYPYWNLTEKIINESETIQEMFHQVFNLSMKTMGEIFIRNNNQINYKLRYHMK